MSFTTETHDRNWVICKIHRGRAQNDSWFSLSIIQIIMRVNQFPLNQNSLNQSVPESKPNSLESTAFSVNQSKINLYAGVRLNQFLGIGINSVWITIIPPWIKVESIPQCNQFVMNQNQSVPESLGNYCILCIVKGFWHFQASWNAWTTPVEPMVALCITKVFGHLHYHYTTLGLWVS